MSGGSKQKAGNNSTSGIGLHSKHQSQMGGLNSTKASHLARIPNASVASAAPASHPPMRSGYGGASLDNSQNAILDTSNTAAANVG